ncbi:MAG: hypothetical protein AAF555_08040 [Verrucomicrobiota bacterium]
MPGSSSHPSSDLPLSGSRAARPPRRHAVQLTRGRETPGFEDQLHDARQQLEALREQQEQIEKSRSQLEGIRGSRELFESEYEDLLQGMTSELERIDRESCECTRRLESLRMADKEIASQLDALDRLQPETWRQPNLLQQIQEGREHLQGIRAAYEEVLAHSARPARRPSDPFLEWMKRGFALTLPLSLILLLCTALLLYFN